MRGVRAWLAIWAGWTSLAVFYAVSTSLTYRSTGRPANWALTFKRSLSEWWLWAALTPLVMWLAGRFPLSGARRWRHLAFHVVFGLVIAVVKTLVDRTTFLLLTGFRTYILLSTIALHFTLYLAIVAAAHGFEYYRRSREREQLEAKLTDTRLQLLSMQLQPHFLFNTLNTIAELVHDEPEAADRMIAGLSDLLRRTLDLGEAQEIALDEELDVLTLYLDIQKVRFDDRLQVVMEVPADLRDARVPTLLLQPLVENSIRHSVAARAGTGRVSIHARSADGVLLIEVVDNGDVREDEPPPARKGIGLNNVRARLEALYGNAASLNMTHTAGKGTRVSVRLPLRRLGTSA